MQNAIKIVSLRYKIWNVNIQKWTSIKWDTLCKSSIKLFVYILKWTTLLGIITRLVYILQTSRVSCKNYEKSEVSVSISIRSPLVSRVSFFQKHSVPTFVVLFCERGQTFSVNFSNLQITRRTKQESPSPEIRNLSIFKTALARVTTT